MQQAQCGFNKQADGLGERAGMLPERMLVQH